MDDPFPCSREICMENIQTKNKKDNSIQQEDEVAWTGIESKSLNFLGKLKASAGPVGTPEEKNLEEIAEV